MNAAAQALATTAAPGRRTNLVRLGFVDDLGFFVNDSDEDGRHDLCTWDERWEVGQKAGGGLGRAAG